MYAINAGRFMLFKRFCGGNVSCNHKFFNKFVAVELLIFLNVFYMAILV